MGERLELNGENANHFKLSVSDVERSSNTELTHEHRSSSALPTMSSAEDDDLFGGNDDDEVDQVSWRFLGLLILRKYSMKVVGRLTG